MAEPGGRLTTFMTPGAVPWALAVLALSVSIVVLALCLLGQPAQASPDPPPTGDWTVDASETVTQTRSTLDLRGDLHVYGSLTLDNCTLWVWSTPTATRTLAVHGGGTLRLVNTQLVAGDPTAPYVVRALRDSTFSALGGSLYRAGVTTMTGGLDSGLYVATCATISQVAFDHCYVGIFVDGASVAVSECDFIDCHLGVAVRDGGALSVRSGLFARCAEAALAEASELAISGARFEYCPEGALSSAGRLTVSGCIFSDIGTQGVGAYGGVAWVENSTFLRCRGDAVVANSATLRASDDRFINCTYDIRGIGATVITRRTLHLLTGEVAILMQRSTFDIDTASTEGSYWALRADRSTGACRNLTAMNATTAVELTNCDGVLLEGLRVDGGYLPPRRLDPRAVVASGSTLTVRDMTAYMVRNAIFLDSAQGLVDGATIRNCSREGVIVRECAGLTLRGVNVTNATDGFLCMLFSAARLEGCHADSCIAGFNFTAGARDTLVECNASGCLFGADIYVSAPRLERCVLYQRDLQGRPLNATTGLRSLESSPTIVGGEITGAGIGAYFNGSRAHLVNVTIEGTEFYCVEFAESPGDVIEGCRLLGLPMGAGVIMSESTPVIRGCLVAGMHYGVDVYTRSAATIEGNTIEDMVYDGILVINNASAALSGNVVRRCGSNSLTVFLYSSATSRGDTFEASGESNVLVELASTLDMESAKVSAASIGVLGIDASYVLIAFTEFQDLNRGVYIQSLASGLSLYVECVVQGCYFHNHSAYCIGISGGHLSVSQCSFLDNIAGIQAWNSTVDIDGCTFVGSWLFGLRTEQSHVNWTVSDLCRIVSSDITGLVSFSMSGGLLEIEDSKLTLAPGSSFEVAGPSVVRMQGASVVGSGGVPFRLDGSSVDLDTVTFEGLGSATGGTRPLYGVALSGCQLTAYNASFIRARGGLSLTGSNATLDSCHVRECSDYGVYMVGSRVNMANCTVERVVLGTGILSIDSTLVANDTVSGFCVASFRATRGTAVFTNCSLVGAEIASLDVEDAIVTLVNTTHDADKVLVNGSGRVSVWWFVSARVLWANASDLPAAVVTVQDATGAVVAEGNPGADGRLGFLLVLALERTGQGTTAYGPHVVAAQLHGYSASRSVMLESSVEVVLSLLDDAPPVIAVVGPPAPETWTGSSSIDVYGRAVDAGSGTATVDVRLDFGSAVQTSEGDVFSFTLRVTSGTHTIELRATDRAGNSANTTLLVHVETSQLALAVNGPMDRQATNATLVTVEGLVSSADALVHVNHALATMDGNRFSYVLDLVEGWNPIGVEASDRYGHRAFANLSVWVDRTPPTLAVLSPSLVNTTDEWAPVEGRVGPDANLTIGGIPVIVRNGTFAVRYPVNLGESLVTVRAVDSVGNEVVAQVIVDRMPVEQPPTGPNWWEAVPFVIALPLLCFMVWYVLARPEEGDGR